MKPEFSIIIPSYNHARYIGRAIESVLAQTFEDWELIIIDDGSPDNSVEVIQKFNDPRIRLLEQGNHDAPYTINRGIREASGNYIAILNSDDSFLPEKLEKCHRVLEDGQDFAFGKLKVIDGDNREIGKEDPRVAWIEEHLSETENKLILAKLLVSINYFVTTSNFVFRKDILEKVGYFHEKLHYSHDFDFLLRAIASGISMKFIPEHLSEYRIHLDNTLSKGRPETIMEACYSIANLVKAGKFPRETISELFFQTPTISSALAFILTLPSEFWEKLVSEKDNFDRKKILNIISYWMERDKSDEEISREIAKLKQEINRLETTVQSMSSSKFWKLRNWYMKCKDRKFFKTIWKEPKNIFLSILRKAARVVISVILLPKIIIGYFFRKSSQIEKKPLVSVIIPCYNYGRYIDEAIDSVLASTYQNLEIIVVDDGPTDPFTIELLKNLKKPKTRVIFQENQGLAKARNNGISASKGDYILPLDADDKIEPTYIEKALYVLQKNPLRAFAYPYVQLFGEENNAWYTEEYNLNLLKEKNIIPSCTLFKKSAWESSGGYNNDRHQYDDWTFWLKMGMNGFYGKLIPEILFFHRKHEGEENMTNRMKARHLEYCAKIKRDLPQLFRRNSLLQKISFGIKNAYQLQRERLEKFPLINLPTAQTQNNKKLLVFLPWTIRGGAEQVTLDVIKNLSEWDIFIVTTMKNEYDSEVDLAFKSVAKNVYHLPNYFKEYDYFSFVDNLISSQDIETVLINHCAWAYANVEKLKSKHRGTSFFDLLHNTMKGGYKESSKKYGEWITKTIVISDELKQNLIHELGLPEEKIACILNGVDIDGVFDPSQVNLEKVRSEMGFPEGKKVVAFIGRLSSEKNPLKFIEIARELTKKFPNEYFFVMAGGGNLIKKAKDEAEKYFEKGEFRIFGNYSHPEKILSLTHALINTSHIEGMPLTIIEALSMKVPVIAPAIGAIGEIIEDGKNGFLLGENPKLEEYVEVITKLRDNAFYSELKENARISVAEKYSARRMAKEYEQVFSEMNKL